MTDAAGRRDCSGQGWGRTTANVASDWPLGAGLDEWLQTRLARPYNVILGIGLVSEIVDRITKLGERLHSAPTIARDILVLAVEFALLLHQVGTLSHHIEKRRTGRTGRRGRAEAVQAEAAEPGHEH